MEYNFIKTNLESDKNLFFENMLDVQKRYNAIVNILSNSIIKLNEKEIKNYLIILKEEEHKFYYGERNKNFFLYKNSSIDIEKILERYPNW